MSRKGFGSGFVSKSKRFNNCFDKNSIDYIYAKLKSTPGPGCYETKNSDFLSRRLSGTSTDISTPVNMRSVILNSIKKGKENYSRAMNRSISNSKY